MGRNGAASLIIRPVRVHRHIAGTFHSAGVRFLGLVEKEEIIYFFKFLKKITANLVTCNPGDPGR